MQKVSDTQDLVGDDLQTPLPPTPIDLRPVGMGPLTRCPLFFHTEGGNPTWKPALPLSDWSMSSVLSPSDLLIRWLYLRMNK